jgi:CRISPR-associated protein Csc2
MRKIDKLYEFIDKKWFVSDLKENRIGHIKIALIREVINPLIIRSTDMEATIILVTDNGREIVEIPPRKLKSREKLLGLMLCRGFGMVNENVRYNSILDSQHLNNPNSILFGDSVTQSQDAAALPSRAIYDWAYSLRDVKDITYKLQHNAMSEDGTILKDKDSNPKQDDGTKVASQALYQTEYILPGTFFPHFITVDNITPELFVHLLSCVLNQRRYGAQTTTNANNMINHLVAIGFADFEKPINSYTISKAWNGRTQKDSPTLDTVKTFINTQMTTYYTDEGLVKNLVELVTWLDGLWKENDKPSLEKIYTCAQESVDEYLKKIKMVKESAGDKKSKGTKKGKETKSEAGNENTTPES